MQGYNAAMQESEQQSKFGSAAMFQRGKNDQLAQMVGTGLSLQ